MVERFSTGAKKLNDVVLTPIIPNHHRIICHYGRNSESRGDHSHGFSFFHHPLHIRTKQEVKPSNLCLFNVLYLDDVADVGFGQSVELLHLLDGAVVIVLQQVRPA